MGSFIGHVVPGTFFGLFGLWWTWAVFHRYFMWQRTLVSKVLAGEDIRKIGKWRNTLSFPCACCPKVPFEGIFKIIAVIIGMTGEFVTGFENGKFQHIGNAQHMTMFFFFGLNGIIDVMTQCRVGAVPTNLDYLSGIMAMCMEALIFCYHLHGRTSMDVQVHTFLVYIIIGAIISSICEMGYKSKILPCLARIFFTLLQSTWFFQVGFILYPPVGEQWNQENHKEMMFVTLFFAWHFAAVFIFMIVVGGLVYCKVNRLNNTQVFRSLDSFHQNGKKMSSRYDSELKNIMESEEEI